MQRVSVVSALSDELSINPLPSSQGPRTSKMHFIVLEQEICFVLVTQAKGTGTSSSVTVDIRGTMSSSFWLSSHPRSTLYVTATFSCRNPNASLLSLGCDRGRRWVGKGDGRTCLMWWNVRDTKGRN